MDIVRPAEDDRLAILPDEILEYILAYLLDSPDLASVSRASRVCERILYPSKTSWQFHEILPHLSRHLPKKDVLNLRLVCSAWAKSIDNFLQNSPYLSSTFSFAPKRSTSIPGFCWAFTSHGGNPFPGRSVDFSKNVDRRFTPGYWIHVFQLLSNFGEHIWSCSFEFSNARFDIFVVILRQCLAQMRNVRRLQISWKFDRSVLSEEKMRQNLEAPRFPPLEKLERLEVKGVFSRLFYEQVLLPLYSKQLQFSEKDITFTG